MLNEPGSTPSVCERVFDKDTEPFKSDKLPTPNTQCVSTYAKSFLLSNPLNRPALLFWFFRRSLQTSSLGLKVTWSLNYLLDLLTENGLRHFRVVANARFLPAEIKRYDPAQHRVRAGPMVSAKPSAPAQKYRVKRNMPEAVPSSAVSESS